MQFVSSPVSVPLQKVARSTAFAGLNGVRAPTADTSTAWAGRDRPSTHRAVRRVQAGWGWLERIICGLLSVLRVRRLHGVACHIREAPRSGAMGHLHGEPRL